MTLQIQNEGYYLQLGVKDALLNALLLAAKRFSSGPPQVLHFSTDNMILICSMTWNKCLCGLFCWKSWAECYSFWEVLFFFSHLFDLQWSLTAVSSSWQLLTQICLALSALIIRSTEHGKPIEQLFYSLQSLQSQDDSNIAVLEMLTVLPEEIFENQNTDCNISSDRRCQYGREVYEISLLLWHFEYFSFPPFWLVFSLLMSQIFLVKSSSSRTLLEFWSTCCSNQRKVLMVVFKCMKRIEKFCVAYWVG